MCLSYTMWEGHRERKAAKSASRKSRDAMLAERAAAETERNMNDAARAKEMEAADAGAADELSTARRRRGVQSTYLNDQLGE